MTTNVNPIPDGYHAVTPYLILSGAADAIEFYKKAFGASERMRLSDPEGKRVMHAELQLGDSIVMLADECGMPGIRGPKTLGGTATSIHLYVEDVDAIFDRAVAAGATSARPVADQFYGDRSGTVVDPFGHVWNLSTHVEDVPPEEISKRFAAMCSGGQEAS